jgi:hypothetical protein
MSDKLDTDGVNLPKETVRDTTPRVVRDPVTGKFLAGTKAGPGRPKGLKDRLNVQVIETLEALWTKRGAEIIDQLAAEKPEVVASLIARMIPQELATQAITGTDETEKAEGNQEVRITLINQVKDDATLTHNDIPKLVEGEVLPADTTH